MRTTSQFYLNPRKANFLRGQVFGAPHRPTSHAGGQAGAGKGGFTRLSSATQSGLGLGEKGQGQNFT